MKVDLRTIGLVDLVSIAFSQEIHMKAYIKKESNMVRINLRFQIIL